ncbi:MAG: isochorismatase family protein, partial [Clostridia bacterium]|nr:isochorismatase family protein [Clostridia bacterium]
HVIDKCGFGSVALAEFAAREKFDAVNFVGVCTDICVISNVLTVKSYLPEAELTVISDLCAGVTEESHKTALAAMRAAQINIL